MDQRRRPFQRVLYTIAIAIADTIEDIFFPFSHLRPTTMVRSICYWGSPRTLTVPVASYIQPSDAAAWSQNEFLDKLERGTYLQEDMDPYQKFIQLDDVTAAKEIWLNRPPSPPDSYREVLAMKFVCEKTTIPIPTVYQVFPEPDDADFAYIVMDYVAGTRLDHAWPTLSILSKIRVAWILRGYIRQLRRLEGTRPGPLGEKALRCTGNVVSGMREEGPFQTADELTRFMNKRSHRISGAPIPREYEIAEPLVFTHNDLNMRNIILGHDGLVWLIDWDWAGFYPRSFEFLAMSLAAEGQPGEPIPSSWRLLVPFITEPAFGRLRWLVGLSP